MVTFTHKEKNIFQARVKDDSSELIKLAIKGIQEKKGHDIVRIDLSEVSGAVTNDYIICHGTSNTQVEAIADSVEKEIKEQLGELPWHKEGKDNAEWILLDYVTTIVHIFHKEKREFYNIEGLWADAEHEYISEEII